MSIKYLYASIIALVVIITTVAFINPEKAKAPQQTKPNVLIILVDQYRGEALGLENKEQVITPNLDKLGKSGFVSTQMIATYPVCSPSRAMIMSGRYPFSNRVCGNVNSVTAPYGVELPKDMVCWSDVLKDNGYSNGYIGKWHLDSPHKPFIPTENNKGNKAWNEWTTPDRRHGFNYWYAYGTYDDHMRPMYWDGDANRDGFHFVDEWGPIHEADKTISFIDNKGSAYRDGSKPFALVVSMNPPHSNYKAVPQKYVDIYKNVPIAQLIKDPNIPAAGTPMGNEYRKNIKYYYACITGVDEQIGRIINKLEQTGLDKNTIVIFTADHGNCLGKHDEISKNNIYEESLRVPFIVSWKGHIKPRIDSTLLMNTPDIYPTLLEMVGLKSKIPASVEGKSMSQNILQGKGTGFESQFFLGNINPAVANSGFRGVRTRRYKLAYVRDGKEVQPYLYDLQKDPFELNNIYSANNKQVTEMLPMLKAWLAKTNDKFPIN